MLNLFSDSKLSIFARDETAAVSVDWVVLTASVVGLGLAAATSVSVGVTSLGGAVDASLSNAQVGTLQFAEALPPPPTPYSIQRLDEAGIAYWTADFASKTNAQLLDQVVLRHDQFQSHLAARNWMQAIQRVDYYHLITQELAARNIPFPANMPTTETLFQMYNDARA